MAQQIHPQRETHFLRRAQHQVVADTGQDRSTLIAEKISPTASSSKPDLFCGMT